DVLNSYINFSKLGKWVPIIATQVQKRNPVNLRRLLRIKKSHNAKAFGLLLDAYSVLYKIEPFPDIKNKIKFFFDWLCKNYSKGYSGYCWGYNFDWAGPGLYLKAYTPSIVATSFVAKGIFNYYELTKDEEALNVLISICDFILNDLPITEYAEGLCFSYTPLKRNCCYNSSMLGAEILAKVHSITGKSVFLDFAQKAVDFIIENQHDDGHWNYSKNIINGKERRQIDFHQGFILSSLLDFMVYGRMTKGKYKDALIRGIEFYKQKQFFKDGRSKWRIPKVWPVDIHNQAVGIFLFSKLIGINSEYLGFAQNIADWTIKNMQDEIGYFYYQKHKFLTNKISYMRWSQAWMMLALVYLIREMKKK
ncbi:MAG: hypothetical protein ACFFDN_42870, partial [Candidatus Hodarchaeota archaeon]